MARSRWSLHTAKSDRLLTSPEQATDQYPHDHGAYHARGRMRRHVLLGFFNEFFDHVGELTKLAMQVLFFG